MATIAQRLVAAGASPERARAFEQQFTKKVQTAQPGLGKPKDIQDAFDAEIAAFAAAAYPNVFRPPTINDPRIAAYIQGAYGPEVLKGINDKAWQAKAPDVANVIKRVGGVDLSTANDAQLAALGLDAFVVGKVLQGVPVGEIKNTLASGAIKVADPKNPKVSKTITGALLPSEYGALVDKYSGQYGAAIEENSNQVQNFLESDKYYKVGLPTPKIKYGRTEDLAQGVIPWTTHPSVDRILKTQGVRAKQLAQTAPAGYIGASGGGEAFNKMRTEAANFEDNLFNEFLQSGATPFGDEVKRREKLKKSTTLTGK